MTGDSDFPLGKMIVFLFNMYLVPLCFRNILQSVCLLSQRKQVAFLFCGVGDFFF